MLEVAWRLFRRASGIVESDVVQNVVLLVIVTQAITLGVEASTSSYNLALSRFNLFVLIFSSLESSLQIVHHGVHQALKRHWLCFDVFVIIVSWVFHVMVFRSLRILFVVRLTSRLTALQDVLKALVGMFPKLMAIVGLLLLFLYVYAVLCTNLFSDLHGETDEDYFGGIDKTLFTLFQLMTLADWNHVVDQVAQHSSFARYVFVSFIVISSFILYSLITAVICEAVTDPSPDSRLSPRIHAMSSQVALLHQRQQWILEKCQYLRGQTGNEQELIVFIDSMRTPGSSPPTKAPILVNKESNENIQDAAVCWSTFRRRCGEFVNQERTQMVVTALIFLNAVSVGIGTFDFATENESAKRGFDVVDRVFLVIFTFELVLQLIHNCSLSDAWLCFDLGIVITSWSFEQLQVARAFRVVRVVRLGGKMETLRELLQALVDVAPSVSAIIAFLLLIIYIFAVLCTTLLGDAYEMGVTDDDYFGSLEKSLFTLFQTATLENWTMIVRQMEKEYSWIWLLFIPFVILTNFMLFSLIIAVLCDAVAQDDDDRYEAEAQIVIDRMILVVEQMTHQQVQLLRQIGLQTRSTSLTVSDECSFGSESSSTPSEQWSVCLVDSGQQHTHLVTQQSTSSAGSEQESASSGSSICIEITSRLGQI